MLGTNGVNVNWCSSSTLVENAFLFGLCMRALGGVGYKESVDL